jgi:transcription initiation factor TFIIIB Brf1 subunit/transcription initiation factor TFIIB
MTAQCKHPIVKIVSRDEDAEFVECQTCGEIFDSAEFNDMAIEEEALDEDDDDKK